MSLPSQAMSHESPTKSTDRAVFLVDCPGGGLPLTFIWLSQLGLLSAWEHSAGGGGRGEPRREPGGQIARHSDGS